MASTMAMPKDSIREDSTRIDALAISGSTGVTLPRKVMLSVSPNFFTSDFSSRSCGPMPQIRSPQSGRSATTWAKAPIRSW